MVKSINTLDRDAACLSDHFGISFNIEFPIGRKKGPKKKVYNYKKADWKNLKFELKRVYWGFCSPYLLVKILKYSFNIV